MDDNVSSVSEKALPHQRNLPDLAFSGVGFCSQCCLDMKWCRVKRLVFKFVYYRSASLTAGVPCELCWMCDSAACGESL